MLPNTIAAGSYLSPAMKKELDWTTPLQSGAKGAGVKRLQEHLVLNGLPLGIDSDFGPATLKRVKDFQTKRALPVTGVVDAATHAALVEPMVRAIRPIPAQGRTLSELTAAYALQHVEQGPREAGGDNRGPWVRAYLGWDGPEARWCAGFVCYALEQAAHTLGVKAPIGSSASCDVLALNAKAAKQSNGQPRFVRGATLSAAQRQALPAGSFFLVRKTATDWIHVGILADADADTFDTVEGNTNNEGSSNGFEATTRTRNYKDKDFIVWT
jgi:hypothetical protein